MNPENKITEQHAQKLARVIEIQRELDARKTLYAELDLIIMQLQKEGFKEGVMYEGLEALFIELVDNFETGNVCYRPAGVKRFEIEVEAVADRERKAAKRAKKAGAQ